MRDEGLRLAIEEEGLHSRANGKKSSIRARVEHVFTHQKERYGLFIGTIGLARAEAKLTLANIRGWMRARAEASA